MNPTSIATVSISGDLAEKLTAIAAAGFEGIEVFENDFLSFDGGPRDVGRMVSDLGLKIYAFQPFRDFEGMPEPLRARTFARAARKFEVMNALGAELMLPDVSGSRDPRFEAVDEPDATAERPVYLMMHPERARVPSVAAVAAFIEETMRGWK